MLFQKRTDFSPSKTVTLGSTVQFEITREFHIERITLVVKFDYTQAGTKVADGVWNLVNKLQLQISDGARTRNVVDISGPGLLEYDWNIMGGLDRDTATLNQANTSGTGKTLYYPIYCAHPQLDDPVGSTFLLPAPRYNSNPVLSVLFSTQAQMDINATLAFALANATCYLIVDRRQVNRANWPTLDWELAEVTTPYASTGASQLYELQIPGSYTAILMRDYTATNSARAWLGTTGSTVGENKLQLLGTVIRRFHMEDVLAENDASSRLYPATWTNPGNHAFLDFISDKTGESSPDLGSVLDANILAASGARLQLLQDINTAGVRKYVTHRVFGNLSSLKFGGGGATSK